MISDQGSGIGEKIRGTVRILPYGDTERQVEIPWLLETVKPAGHQLERLLDIGAAGAHYLAGLIDTGAEVWCIDTQPLSAIPVAARPVRCSADDMPAAWSNYFDVVTCISVLDHVGLEAYGNEPDPAALQKTAEEIRRVLRKGGRLLATVPTGKDMITTHGKGDEDYGEQRVFSLEALQDLFPHDIWHWYYPKYWRLNKSGIYKNCEYSATRGASYAGHRAEAVVAIELSKL